MKRKIYTLSASEIRCRECSKLLATGNLEAGEIVLSCPRCGTRHILRASRPNAAPPDGLQGDRHAPSHTFQG
ncbi:MAG: Com family DNA-binding transcriptional regulator [Desulfovibrio sp.]|nr:Com family DNA-binding transcriptional regulator [Desulfovibrio sp.]